ncbi:MAG: hypothetical protein ACREFQ_04030 [Stellaceae bacterium]
MIRPGEEYLGDGLYASFDGYAIILRAPREHGDHWVGLKPRIFAALVAYEKRLRQKYADANNETPTQGKFVASAGNHSAEEDA